MALTWARAAAAPSTAADPRLGLQSPPTAGPARLIEARGEGPSGTDQWGGAVRRRVLGAGLQPTLPNPRVSFGLGVASVIVIVT